MQDNIKILLVDDEKNFAKSLQMYLQMEGYSVEVANDAAEALDCAQHNIYSLIISDVLMPGMDGYELRKKLRALENTSKTPIIMLTAKEATIETLKDINDNMTSFIMKPFDHAILLEEVSNLINRNS